MWHLFLHMPANVIYSYSRLNFVLQLTNDYHRQNRKRTTFGRHEVSLFTELVLVFLHYLNRWSKYSYSKSDNQVFGTAKLKTRNKSSATSWDWRDDDDATKANQFNIVKPFAKHNSSRFSIWLLQFFYLIHWWMNNIKETITWILLKIGQRELCVISIRGTTTVLFFRGLFTLMQHSLNIITQQWMKAGWMAGIGLKSGRILSKAGRLECLSLSAYNLSHLWTYPIYPSNFADEER